MFRVTGDAELLAEMDEEFSDLCLAEDYSSDEEKIKAGCENMWNDTEWEVNRYLAGKNHHLIGNLNTDGGHFLQHLSTMNNKK